MKFLVITDLHENTSAVEWINRLAEENDVRAILFLGDVTDLSSGEVGIDILKQFKKETYFIPGNCDPTDIPEKACKVVNSVHGKSFEIDGLRFAAFGGSNPTIFDTPFETKEEDIYKVLDSISSEKMVLMTHAPSYGILDEIPSGLSVGSTAIRDIVKKYHPILALSGHIHEAIGIKEIDGTLFFNPGPAKEGHAGLVEIIGDKVTAKAVGPSD